MNFKSTLLMMLLTVGLAQAEQQQIHPDCVMTRTPVLCTATVNQILKELDYFNAVFAGTNVAVEAAAFYHERATLYTKASDTFYIGRDQILTNYFAPFVANIAKAHVDIQFLRFQYIDPETVIVWGRPTASVVLKDGTMLTQPPLPQTLTFVRNERYDPKRPFVILADQE